MTPEEIQHFEGIITKAVQSGKKETSDLVDMVIHRLEPAVEKSINKYVNGKLDKINQKIDDYIVSDLQLREREKEQTIEWRKNADEKLKVVGNLQGFGKVSLYVAGFIASIAGVVMLMIKLVGGKSIP